MSIQINDFIEIEYVGRIKSTGKIFDLTDEKIAKENKIYNEKSTYGAIIICVGQRDVVPGFDDSLVGKTLGNYVIEVKAGMAFGDRNPKLISLIPAGKFKKEGITPFPGMPVSLDRNAIGVVRSVSGGRVVVDFNHPLAGKDVVYDVKIIRIISDDEEKLKGYAMLHFNAEAKLKDGIAEIKAKVPVQIRKVLSDKIKELIPSIKEVKFEQPVEKALAEKTLLEKESLRKTSEKED